MWSLLRSCCGRRSPAEQPNGADTPHPQKAPEHDTFALRPVPALEALRRSLEALIGSRPWTQQDHARVEEWALTWIPAGASPERSVLVSPAYETLTIDVRAGEHSNPDAFQCTISAGRLSTGAGARISTLLGGNKVRGGLCHLALARASLLADAVGRALEISDPFVTLYAGHISDQDAWRGQSKSAGAYAWARQGLLMEIPKTHAELAAMLCMQVEDDEAEALLRQICQRSNEGLPGTPCRPPGADGRKRWVRADDLLAWLDHVGGEELASALVRDYEQQAEPDWEQIPAGDRSRPGKLLFLWLGTNWRAAMRTPASA